MKNYLTALVLLSACTSVFATTQNIYDCPAPKAIYCSVLGYCEAQADGKTWFGPHAGPETTFDQATWIENDHDNHLGRVYCTYGSGPTQLTLTDLSLYLLQNKSDWQEKSSNTYTCTKSGPSSDNCPF